MGKALIIRTEGTKVIEVEDVAYEPTREEILAEKQAVIDSLKAQIAESDYKVIKCAEAQLMGEELPYNVAELHAQRQALRNEINVLESEILNL
ncbi:MAG: hypothetical protein IJE21_07385 [Alistipes sp.]|nr:hypothetical protein [Alistipes sp.]